MDNYLNPQTHSLMQLQYQLCLWFEKNPNIWREKIEDEFNKQSNGKFRVFHTFFESPNEALSGKFKQQALSENDIKQMYPKFYDSVTDIEPNSYCYIFACNGGAGPGQALLAKSVISFEK